MPYTVKLNLIHGNTNESMAIHVRGAILTAIERDGRFKVRETSQPFEMTKGTKEGSCRRGFGFTCMGIRLTKAKPYHGQAPGGDRRSWHQPRVMSCLEWEDWVNFHSVVNNVLDSFNGLVIDADVWTSPQMTKAKYFWIRKGTQRRYHYDVMSDGSPNAGTPDQFDMLRRRELPHGGQAAIIPQAVLVGCKFNIFAPEHYRKDGSCKCDDAEHRKHMIAEWEYRAEDFKDIPLRGETVLHAPH